MKKSLVLLMLKKPFIKEAQTIVALLLISLGGCKKDSSDSANKNVREEFTVVETNSNVPVQGAMVTAYTCTSSGLWLCSGAGEPLDSAITNDAGKVVFNTGIICRLTDLIKFLFLFISFCEQGRRGCF